MLTANNERQKLREIAHGFYFSCALFATVRLGLADALFTGAKKIDELALLLNLNNDALKRLINFMVSLNVMQYNNDTITLTDSGKYLASDCPNSLAKEISMFSGGETYQAWGNVMSSIKTGSPAFNNIHGSTLFEYFSSNPETAERFHNGWQEITTTTAKEFVNAYQFSENESILDVGSGYGIFLCTIIKAYPMLTGALYDLPVSLEGAPAVINTHAVEDKVSIIPGDAMESVPVGFSTHLLKSVIHNCNDQQSIQMLTNCSSSLNQDGKVLVVERIVPENSDYHWSKLVDMTMLVMTGGKERTEKEYDELFFRSGLKMTRVINLPSGFSIIEAKKE